MAGQTKDPFQKRVVDVLAEPDLYPDELKVWVVRWVQDNPNLKLPATALPNVEATRYFGAAGQPVFQNAWVALAGGYEDPGFYRDPFNRVHLCGQAKNGAINTPLANLPVGYRPKARLIFTDISNGDTGFRIDVLATGDIIPVSGTNPYISLNGISFRAFA